MDSTMISPAATAPEAERVHVDHGVTKRLGRWTSASQFDVRVRSGVLVLDLRSPEVTGDVEARLGLHRSTARSDHPAEIQRLASRPGNGGSGGAGIACFA